METTFGRVQNELAWLTFSILAICAAIEPRQTVWVMAAAGSFGAVMRGPPRGFLLCFAHWLVGIFLAVAWVDGFDHFQPEAEAFFIGLASGEISKAYTASLGSWAGGALSRLVTGVRNVP